MEEIGFDRFRLIYRNEIKMAVSIIVTDAIPPDKAEKLISDRSQRLPESDREQFIEVINTELLSLHEGNFIRYWIRPFEFERWKTVWSS